MELGVIEEKSLRKVDLLINIYDYKNFALGKRSLLIIRSFNWIS